MTPLTCTLFAAELLKGLRELARTRPCGGRHGAGFHGTAAGARIRRIGVGAVLVQAKDGAAKRLYVRYAAFIGDPAESRTLFLPIETVMAAFD